MHYVHLQPSDPLRFSRPLKCSVSNICSVLDLRILSQSLLCCWFENKTPSPFVHRVRVNPPKPHELSPLPTCSTQVHVAISDRCCSHTNLVLTWLLHRGSSSALSPSPIPKSTYVHHSELATPSSYYSKPQPAIDTSGYEMGRLHTLAKHRDGKHQVYSSTASTGHSAFQGGWGRRHRSNGDRSVALAHPPPIQRPHHTEPDRPGLCVQSSTRGNCRPLTILSSRCFNLFEKPGVRSASR